MDVTTMGLDPSLSHGILGKATWSFGRGGAIDLKDYDVMYAWGKQKAAHEGLHKASSPEEMTAFGNHLLTTVLEEGTFQPAVPLAVDWDEKSVMWRGQAIYAAKNSFLVGYLIRGFQARGTPVVVLTPAAVRTHFGLKNNAKKDAVWDEVDFMPERTNSDTRDFLLLSYILAASEFKRRSKSGRTTA